ncbi:hypothetical protein [Adlercreutzia faecimuris]|uniref:Uncharacterized protein n=1 Tax=Adlercreutzia faecimuris TaxID=2897341 RepID=A0ABS9WHK8_9ACTN|nr:hypothetical protein [Adlercreutzia sp. JBNU-10]MCI2241967.1 hypothetical protein [Adlercreutzia sp. JBNU-10]
MARHVRHDGPGADPWEEEALSQARPARSGRHGRDARDEGAADAPRAEEGSWLDDAFDEGKAAADLERAKTSPALGCGLVAAVAAALALIAFAFTGILGALGA